MATGTLTAALTAGAIALLTATAASAGSGSTLPLQGPPIDAGRLAAMRAGLADHPGFQPANTCRAANACRTGCDR